MDCHVHVMFRTKSEEKQSQRKMEPASDGGLPQDQANVPQPLHDSDPSHACRPRDHMQVPFVETLSGWMVCWRTCLLFSTISSQLASLTCSTCFSPRRHSQKQRVRETGRIRQERGKRRTRDRWPKREATPKACHWNEPQQIMYGVFYSSPESRDPLLLRYNMDKQKLPTWIQKCDTRCVRNHHDMLENNNMPVLLNRIQFA